MTPDKKIAFDPWTATEADMAQDMLNVFKCCDANLRMRQWASAQLILILEAKVKSGDGSAILECIDSVLSSGIVAPQWLADSFSQKRQMVISAQVGSWNDVFGIPHPKANEQKLAAIRQKSGIAVCVWSMTRKLAKEKPTTTLSKIYEEIGRHYNITPEQAGKYNRKIVKLFWEDDAVKKLKSKTKQ